MKKFTRVSLILCAVLAGIGIILGIIGASAGFGMGNILRMVKRGMFSFDLKYTDSGLKWRYDGWSDMEDIMDLELADQREADEAWADPVDGQEEWKEGGEAFSEWLNKQEGDWNRQFETCSEGEVRNLDIDFAYGTLLIEPSESGQIEVEVAYRPLWKGLNRTVTPELKGDTLTIKDSLTRERRWMGWMQGQAAFLTLRIPAGITFREVKLDVGAANVEWNSGMVCEKLNLVIGAGRMITGSEEPFLIQAQRMNLEVGAGYVGITNLKAEELNAECGVGQMELFQVAADKTTLDCGVGQITISMAGKETDYNYEVDTGIGGVSMGGVFYGGLGTHQKVDRGGRNFIIVDCGIGEVDVSFEG